jgi:hypothetical protein
MGFMLIKYVDILCWQGQPRRRARGLTSAEAEGRSAAELIRAAVSEYAQRHGSARRARIELVIVVDTGALIALIDLDDANHEKLRTAFERNPEDWVLPWAILAEADYLVTAHLGIDAAQALRTDLAQGLSRSIGRVPPTSNGPAS